MTHPLYYVPKNVTHKNSSHPFLFGPFERGEGELRGRLAADERDISRSLPAHILVKASGGVVGISSGSVMTLT